MLAICIRCYVKIPINVADKNISGYLTVFAYSIGAQQHETERDVCKKIHLTNRLPSIPKADYLSLRSIKLQTAGFKLVFYIHRNLLNKIDFMSVSPVSSDQ